MRNAEYMDRLLSEGRQADYEARLDERRNRRTRAGRRDAENARRQSEALIEELVDMGDED